MVVWLSEDGSIPLDFSGGSVIIMMWNNPRHCKLWIHLPWLAPRLHHHWLSPMHQSWVSEPHLLIAEECSLEDSSHEALVDVLQVSHCRMTEEAQTWQHGGGLHHPIQRLLDWGYWNRIKRANCREKSPTNNIALIQVKPDSSLIPCSFEFISCVWRFILWVIIIVYCCIRL